MQHTLTLQAYSWMQRAWGESQATENMSTIVTINYAELSTAGNTDVLQHRTVVGIVRLDWERP